MRDRKLILQLGRFGDVVNVLPIALDHYVRTGERPVFMIAREFASVLDGVSYVEPRIYDGPFQMVLVAAFQARRETEDIDFCQIYGQGLVAPQKCTSFAREAWAQGRSRAPWGSLPLVFDARDPIREAKLADRALAGAPGDARPVVLAALGGHSSPFPFRRALLAHLESHFADRYRLVDVSDFRAERFFDLLGLFDRAHALLTVDTGHLHLAAAVPDLPVISLVTRDPSGWHGSPWRPQHVARLYYDEFPGLLALDRLHEWDAWLAAEGRGRRFLHAWADWRVSQDEGTARRASIARESWAMEASWTPWADREFKLEHSTRDGRSIGDPAALHFVRDMIDHAAAGAGNDDVVVVTNADTCLAPGVTGRIADHVRRHGCGFAHRYDFDRLDRAFLYDSDVRAGKFYPGTDLIFFTAGWWDANRDLLGDYVAGREGWDEAFRQLVKFRGGRGIDHAIYHERHATAWEDRHDLGGNVHNRRERERWFRQTGFVPEDYLYFSCVERDPCR